MVKKHIRILAAQTRGQPGIFDTKHKTPIPPLDAYSEVTFGLEFVARGKHVPIFIQPLMNQS